MPITEAQITDTLRHLVIEELGTDLVSSKALHKVLTEPGQITLEIQLGVPACHLSKTIPPQITAALQPLVGTMPVICQIKSKIASHVAQPGVPLITGVKNIIAVASGKGGVGKSTVAVNVALALASEGAQVGILDADIYGPSQPKMLGITERPHSPDGKTMLPLRQHGVQAMSIGFLVDQDTPMIWRGPMVTGALEQLLRDTQWDNLDYLVIDLPPGTGDIQLTMAQKIPVTGAIIVTTPQDIALLDARKGLKMFEKVSIPILGLVENMSTHICSQCGHEEHIFGVGGGQQMCEDYGLTLLGSLPLDASIREQTDRGEPTVVADPGSKIAQLYRHIAVQVAVKIAAMKTGSRFPNIVIQKT